MPCSHPILIQVGTALRTHPYGNQAALRVVDVAPAGLAPGLSALSITSRCSLLVKNEAVALQEFVYPARMLQFTQRHDVYGALWDRGVKRLSPEALQAAPIGRPALPYVMVQFLYVPTRTTPREILACSSSLQKHENAWTHV